MKIAVKERKNLKSLVFEVPISYPLETVLLPIPVPSNMTPDKFYKLMMDKMNKALDRGN